MGNSFEKNISLISRQNNSNINRDLFGVSPYKIENLGENRKYFQCRETFLDTLIIEKKR